jgi:hypothetical protein
MSTLAKLALIAILGMTTAIVMVLLIALGRWLYGQQFPEDNHLY